MPAPQVSQETATATEVTAAPSSNRFRYAAKTSLSLTLAYLIPMAMGWPQPQTAATTVMLIAATGMVSESLQKGIHRVLGTVAGAVIGLTLIALFPQERMVYLLAVSTVVAIIIYLYNAYQGDSTLFMLAAVVTLMVFNGGDAEGAFLYGVDRAFMTAFGVIVYTVVAATIWPVQLADNTRRFASDVADRYASGFSRLLQPAPAADDDELLAGVFTAQETFQNHFAAVKQHADGVVDYRAEWDAILGCYEELEGLLIPGMQDPTAPSIDFSRHIDNYDDLTAHIGNLFDRVQGAWRGQRDDSNVSVLPVTPRAGSLAAESHLTVAAVAARADLLDRLQPLLIELITAMESLLFDRSGFVPGRQPEGKPAFRWLDQENLKTAVRAFLTFWLATVIWIAFNPPGGFMFVTMSTVLIPLVSFTPVTPRLLIILFSLGFFFALPAYVLLLPQMTHWLQLAAFIFAYAFFGFYVFQGPVSIFFLLGLFTLGIQNTMSYHVDAILLIILMFYMICALLIISIYIPFSSRPEVIYASLRRRFFNHCATCITLNPGSGRINDLRLRLHQSSAGAVLAKMHSFGPMIDADSFPANEPQKIARLNRACELLHGQLQSLCLRRNSFSDNPLIASARRRANPNPMAELCDTLAANRGVKEVDRVFQQSSGRLTGIGKRLDDFLGERPAEQHDRSTLARFYVYLNQQAAIRAAIEDCRQAQQALDWLQLRETRF